MTDTSKDGGSAFPIPDALPSSVVTAHGGYSTPGRSGSNGMSLRDWFAGRAMQGLIEYYGVAHEDLAGRAFDVADAMLAARARKDSDHE